MEKIFGIDLGTTYSCISFVDENGKPVIVQNSENERTTPSVVFFDDDGSIIVGAEAKKQLAFDPEKVVSFVKRSMGDPNYVFLHNDKSYKPEEISSYILRKVVQDASQILNEEIKNVVITCPAYFGENERNATKIAGEIAGLNVKDIINEPTAAALSYGIEKDLDQVVLVYDLGGGTFDVSLIQIKQGSITVVVTGGDHNLGGKNWDDALTQYFANEFKKKTGGQINILDDSKVSGEMELSAESVKKTLTLKDKAKTRIVFDTDRVDVEVSRDQFDTLTSYFLGRAEMLTDKLMEEAKNKGINTFDKILMVGGSTRMPQVKESLSKAFPGIPIESHDPDEAVAKGAAIYGSNLLLRGEVTKILSDKLGISEDEVDINKIDEKTLFQAENDVAKSTGYTIGGIQKARTKITNVVSKSFGLKLFVGDELKIVNMIMKQTPLPFDVKNEFGTKYANQNSVLITLYENELDQVNVDLELGKVIGEGIIEGLPANLPAGSPIEVTFRINEEGCLDVYAIELAGKNELRLSIVTTSVISGQELEEAKERSKSMKVI